MVLVATLKGVCLCEVLRLPLYGVNAARVEVVMIFRILLFLDIKEFRHF
jgi:hypothetical protein